MIRAGTARKLNAHQVSRSASRHLRRYLRDVGLSLEALAAELPGLGLADRSGIAIAIQPGQDDPCLLAGRLRSRDCPNLGIALDSATWQPAPERAAALGRLVGLVHLRDVRRVGDRIEEVADGEDVVDFAAWLGPLAEGGYAGALTVRRDAAGVGIDAMRQGRDYVGAPLQGLTKRQAIGGRAPGSLAPVGDEPVAKTRGRGAHVGLVFLYLSVATS